MTDARKVRVAVIGTGWFGGIHARAYRDDPAVELVAVCGRDLARAQTRAAELGGVRAYTDIRALCEREQPDLVGIVTQEKDLTPALHALLPALRQSRDRAAPAAVLTEKPLGASAAEARQILRLAADNGIDLGVNFNRRYAEPFQYAARWIADGTLGELSYLQFKQVSEPHEPEGAGDPLRTFKNVFPHAFDLAQWLGGPVATVTAQFSRPANHRYFRRYAVSFRYENGAVGTLTGSGEGGWRHQSEYAEICGQRATVAIENATERLTLRPNGGELQTVWKPDNTDPDAFDVFGGTTRRHLRVAVAALRAGGRLPIPAVSGLAAHTLMEAAIASAQGDGAIVRATEQHLV